MKWCKNRITIVSFRFDSFYSRVADSTKVQTAYWKKGFVDKEYCDSLHGFVCQRPAATGFAQEQHGIVYFNFFMGDFSSNYFNTCAVYRGCYSLDATDATASYDSPTHMTTGFCLQVCGGSGSPYDFFAVSVRRLYMCV